MDKKLIGIDLGGTTIKFAILTAEGDVQQKWAIETNILDEGSHIVPDIIESINHHLDLYDMKPSDFIGIGMGSPGTVDRHKGTVTGAYNLDWKDTQELKRPIEEGTGIAFSIDNDANVAALGEQWRGAGNNHDDVVLVTLGTGVGGGIIADGHLLHGERGAAGEIGHITVDIDDDAFECTCGKKGCLETVSSATGIVRLARHMAEEFAGDSALKEAIDNGTVTAKEVYDNAKAGDKFAEMVTDRVHQYLGLACANIGNMLNPSEIVIGGGVSAAGDYLLNGVKQYFNQYTFPTVRNSTVVKLAELGNDAGVIGAASLALKAAE